ncbi:MAG: hypothetical protein Q8T09_13435 [Candidatus Melainabacteria bacterium]|nr:hypothetical protein [Candidatus Melainabacteria bacterium]
MSKAEPTLNFGSMPIKIIGILSATTFGQAESKLGKFQVFSGLGIVFKPTDNVQLHSAVPQTIGQ